MPGTTVADPGDLVIDRVEPRHALTSPEVPRAGQCVDSLDGHDEPQPVGRGDQAPAPQLRDALRVLPDPVEGDQIAAFLAPYGITLDELVSRMGGTT